MNHATSYSYDVPVYLEPHVVRLRPRSDGSQRLLNFKIKIDPKPSGIADSLDQDGNATTQTWFDAPSPQLRVETSFEVETLRENAFDFLLPADAMHVNPFSYAEPWRTLLAPYIDSVNVSSSVAEFARQMARTAFGRTMPFLGVLTRYLFDGWSQIVRADGPPHSSEATLDSHEGSCRDLAVLFCDACRSLGLAARFVSGYERASAGNDHPYMHAWAEVYLPGGGWRGYDPSRGLAVTTDHIAVAAARSPSLAAPVSGTFRGAPAARMEATISMRTE